MWQTLGAEPRILSSRMVDISAARVGAEIWSLREATAIAGTATFDT